MIIDLILLTKNGTTQMGELTIEADYVPRVGEVIDLTPMNIGGETPTFFVTEVTHVCADGKLVPELRCRQWFNGDRRDELEDLGWL